MSDAFEALLGGPPPVVPRVRSEVPVVLFHTPWKRPDDGWSVAARAYARAMDLGGLDVRLMSFGEYPSDPDAEVEGEVGHLAKPCTRWDLHVFSTVVQNAKLLRPQLAHLLLSRGPHAFHCVFERQQLEPELVQVLNLLAGVWAQCSANRDVLVRCGVQNVRLIYHPYFDDDPLLELGPPRESKRFYWIGRFEPRKAPENILRAFLRAFRPGEARLTLKLSAYPHNHRYLTHEDVLLAELSEAAVRGNGWTLRSVREDIRIVAGRLTKREIIGLHAANDVYVSASRGEGLDLPCFAAKLAGRRVVTTDSGGPRDFIGDGDELVPATGSVPAAADYHWGEGATYIDYSLDDLVAALQRARATSCPGSRVPEAFRAENVGRAFRSWAEELTAGR